MRCARASELMSLCLDSLVPEEQEQLLADHLLTCARCREEWQAMQRVHGLLDSVALATPSPLLQERIMNNIQYDCVWRKGVVPNAGILFWQVVIILGGLGLMALVSALRIVYNEPFVVATLVRGFVHVLSITDTLVRAIALLFHAVFGDPSGVLVIGCGLLVSLLLFGGIRLLRPARMAV